MRLAVAVALFISFTHASAQTVSVNLQRVLVQSQEGQLISARLDSKWRPQADALERRESDLKAERAKFDRESRRRRGWRFWRRHVMSRKQRMIESARLAATQQAIDRERDDLRLDFDAERIRVLNEIGKRMTAVAERYAAEHGFSLEYFDPDRRDHKWGTDVTREVVQLYDRFYPSPPAPAPPAPAH